MQPIRKRTAIEMRLFTSGKASSSSPVLVLKVPNMLSKLVKEGENFPPRKKAKSGPRYADE